MCGICGQLKFDKDENVNPAAIKQMADSIAHRGPDDEGFYICGQLGFGFRRLSIIDLGGGHQPLSNENGSIWIIFNGEIYNYRELRDWLLAKGHLFRTNSDTETIVHLYEEVGEKCVDYLRGMFAFCIWDKNERSLMLARDRIGIKPIYYYVGNEGLVFGSEIKALLANPSVECILESRLIDRVLSFNYLPGEDTLLKGIKKLAPASYMTVKNGDIKVRQYWDLTFERSALTLPQAQDQLAGILEESVRLHLISDVPIGFLLSGGVDSTAMLSLARGITQHQLSTFTVGFSDPHIPDERPYAKLAAETYGSSHHELTITANDFADFLPKYTWYMEEPVCEPPAVALFYVSKLARHYVKVLISGEGGDEAFGGYQVYRNTLWLERVKKVLGPTRGAVAASLLKANLLIGSKTVARYAPFLNLPIEANYLSGTSNRLNFFNEHPQAVYSPDFLHFVSKQASFEAATRCWRSDLSHDLVSQMLYADIKTWLPHDLLLKADKMTMATSIELRVPFLDHKVLEFAASLPGNFKVRGFSTKYIAKKALRDRIPHEILRRRKTGFPIPYLSWLRGELKGWVRDLLLDTRTIERGYFQRKSIEQLLDANGKNGVYAKEVFTLAVLELWHREFIDIENSAKDARPLLVAQGAH